ncbi:GrpB family protein [Arthrobacter sp. 35W]|uniref:GrpB family protein n=1 Tax=Arthrobacter sp. 35W TaxID=1132441 RepID=UPI0006877774|nr:GrpB family protein [Arthrobacter sp. 35W]
MPWARSSEAFDVLSGLPYHHLYLVVVGSEPHRDHVDLRNHLRASPIAAARYAAVKRELAPLLAVDRQQYVEGKSAIVTELLAQARAEAAPPA